MHRLLLQVLTSNVGVGRCHGGWRVGTSGTACNGFCVPIILYLHKLSSIAAARDEQASQVVRQSVTQHPCTTQATSMQCDLLQGVWQKMTTVFLWPAACGWWIKALLPPYSFMLAAQATNRPLYTARSTHGLSQRPKMIYSIECVTECHAKAGMDSIARTCLCTNEGAILRCTSMAVCHTTV